jgi:hypothetical protein
MTMVWIARFRARSPPRLSRCRMVLPLLACNGLVPDSAAKAASLRHRPGWEKRHDGLSCGDRADGALLGQPGSGLVNDDLQLGPVGR